MSDIQKLKEIDQLLNDDVQLEKYINEIQEKQIETPLNLKEKISSKISRKNKKFCIDICKIAACLIFSLAICRTDFIKNDDFKKREPEEVKTTISIDEKISDICKWLTTPLNFEKEEK